MADLSFSMHQVHNGNSLKWLAVMLFSFFATCCIAREEKEATKLTLNISADANVNPDPAQRASPIKLRIYELKDSSSFADADYFSLDSNDKVVLTGDLLVKDEYILRPSETRKIERKSHPQTTAIGILAGYRDLPNSLWRVIYKLPSAPEAAWYRFAIPANKTSLLIQLQAQGIVLVEQK
ncbi:type VI secretion system lipoprotein TssJ [Undibacterium curvum]|uniref:Type VI secretion system lipoprotein TssJ n=1 Tax=Undibacterium curvum TaxID=2762294 RepID=A0ABR7A9S8_9BURK|nr:type VI secretion system lipoprotein TssJ [Undibacterium curvum]MBC3933663.1 type VI secretion system lipoprotein TssJ [Undibacterium curvum]